MAIEFSGKLDKSDAIAFMDLLNHPIGGKGKYSIPLWAVLVHIGIGLGIAGLLIVFIELWAGIFFLALAITIVFGSYMVKKNQIKQTGELFEKSPPIEGEMDNEGIKVKSQLVDNSIKWKAYTGYGEKDNYCMLFENNVMVLGLKRSFFTSEEEWKKALLLISQNVLLVYGGGNDSNKLELRNLLPVVVIILLFIYLIVKYK